MPDQNLRGDILQERQRLIGPSLSLSYHEPLHIVRGEGTYLYDADGRAYLDCVNNVCHVGHCHPRVVAAASRQMSELNTNTRYLHEQLVRYAEALIAILPDPLSVCYFVNSGSEANDLALRLARPHTGKAGVAVLDHAYHGNLSSLIDISPYKFNGPGGGGKPDHVTILPLPDTYRGEYGSDVDAYVTEGLSRIDQHGAGEAGLAALFTESMASCAGQIEYPRGYLERIYAGARSAGAVCVADEVQVGFGRVGSHFWGFETQNVVPDIVTMGKPIGNGHPLGAVVTTTEVAASFANGMEYFNTFGGNPVSCAVGLEVLAIIRDERLQENALETGSYLVDGLRALQEDHEMVGDVRGRGLFLGVELVGDRDARTPAARKASELVNRMKEHGVLLSTDGPDHNVIKIKPPVVFRREDADVLLQRLAEELRVVQRAQGKA